MVEAETGQGTSATPSQDSVSEAELAVKKTEEALQTSIAIIDRIQDNMRTSVSLLFFFGIINIPVKVLVLNFKKIL